MKNMIKLFTIITCLVSASPSYAETVTSTAYGRGLLSQTESSVGPYLNAIDATPFTVAVIPDTQTLTAFSPAQLTNMINWICSNKTQLNLKMVLNLGDMVETNAVTSLPQSQVEWDRVLVFTNFCRSNIPNLLIVGNHDIDNYTTRTYTNFNNRFNPNYFTSQVGFGGFQSNSFPAEGMYFLQTNSGMKMCFIGLTFGPQDEALTWAGNICQTYSNHSVVITTHSYMNNDNTRMSPGDAYTAASYPFGVGSVNDGYQIWAKLGRVHKNIIYILSGHQLSSGTGRQVSIGQNGNVVSQELINFQGGTDLSAFGNSIRLLTFYPSLNSVYNTTYAQTNDSWFTNSDYQFSTPIRTYVSNMEADRSLEIKGYTNNHSLLTTLDMTYYVNGYPSNRFSLMRSVDNLGRLNVTFGTNDSSQSNSVIGFWDSNFVYGINRELQLSNNFRIYSGADDGSHSKSQIRGASTGNLIIEATNDLYLNYSQGRTVLFCDGVGSTKLSVSNNGALITLHTNISIATNLTWTAGNGVPTFSATKGSLYSRLDAPTGDAVLYANTNGTTGWNPLKGQ